jgi:SNF2 family DNA or RNA helicase
MNVVSTVDLTRPAPGVAESIPGYAALIGHLERGAPVDEGRSRLVEQALAMWARPGFDTFLSLPDLRFEPFDYQLRAAGTVLRRMRGRAILADEVGLGKTIEACIVLSELRLRGLARSILILVPPGLMEQWREELERKFGLPSALLTGAHLPPDSLDPPVLLASLAAARRQPLKDALAQRKWDLVVVDEAHRLKNPRSASAKAVQALSTRHLLLLTATPVENRLDDLFHLASLVSPGLLGSARDFRARHGSGVGEPRNLAALRGATEEVMVRHRRSEVALMLPRRLARTVCVEPSAGEAALYAAVSDRVRLEGRDAPPSRRLGLLTTQRLAGSSPAALGTTLAKAGWEDLAAEAAGLGATMKARTLVELLKRHQASGEKVVVFTAFRQTLEYLVGILDGAGIQPAVYHGSLPRAAKEQAVEDFRAGAEVLLTTEAAGEGRNLQFCHVMVNFDLPWNPMQIEQRLGRLHRIGQTHDVVLHNLVARGTVEDRILRLLETRINLFELVVGELDMILGQVDEEFDFESFVFQAHVSSADDAEFAGRLDALGEGIADARSSYLRSREDTDRLVGQTGAGVDAVEAGTP